MLVASSATSAGATPTPTGCEPYPPGAHRARLTVSTTTPAPGQAFTVAGTNLVANEPITIDLDGSTVLASLTTSAGGSFSTQVTLPGSVTGTHTISVAGDNSVCAATSVTVSVQSGIEAAATSQAQNQSQNLAGTGVDIALGLVAAAGLLVVGIVLSRVARRRSASNHS